jgi:hypothetical protein
MIYRLYRLADYSERWQDGEELGRFATFDAALAYRDRDVLAVLDANWGYWVIARHTVVGPGLSGPVSEVPLTTALGVDPNTGRIPTADDRGQEAAWLASIRRASTAPVE